MKTKFDVMGMTCSACSAHVEKAVKKLEGVNGVEVNLLTNSMVVDYDGIDTNAIVKAVRDGGYDAAPVQKAKKTAAPAAEGREMSRKKAVDRFFCVHDSTVLFGDGTYDGLAAAYDFPRGGECTHLSLPSSCSVCRWCW